MNYDELLPTENLPTKEICSTCGKDVTDVKHYITSVTAPLDPYVNVNEDETLIKGINFSTCAECLDKELRKWLGAEATSFFENPKVSMSTVVCSC